MSSRKLNAERRGLQCRWYKQLKELILDLEANPRHAVLDNTDQQRLGIRLTHFSANPDSEPELGFFTPLRREELPISPCDPSLYDPDGYDSDGYGSHWPRRPRQSENDWLAGRELADGIMHNWYKMSKRRSSVWQRTG
jgi:hypothetical protein